MEPRESKNIEDYLETLYSLTRKGGRAKTTEISERLTVAPASVTEMLQKLQAKGYVNYSAYQGTTLTPEGRKIGEKITRKHRLLERFLSDVLHIGKNQVHAQACEMEHALSDQAEESLRRFLTHLDKITDQNKIRPCDR